MFLCKYHKNSYEISEQMSKSGFFPIPIAFWWGFGIFKQNRGNPDEIRMVTGVGFFGRIQKRICDLRSNGFFTTKKTEDPKKGSFTLPRSADAKGKNSYFFFFSLPMRPRARLKLTPNLLSTGLNPKNK